MKLFKNYKNIYWQLLFVFIAIAAIGIVYIYSASHQFSFGIGSFAFKQTVWLVLAIILIFIIDIIGYKKFLDFAYIFYCLSLILLLTVFFLGVGKYGAQRWILFFGFALQPSEFAKIATVLTLARYMGSRSKNINQKKSFIISFFITLVPLFLIIKQPDLGTSLIFLPILFSMLFFWGAKLKYIFISVFMGLVSLPFLWTALKPYQKKRLFTFINPNADPLGAGYTTIQSKIAVGSGGFWGKGFMMGTQNRLNFVPEHHTDFIFCVIAEEGGFLMALLLIGLFLLLIFLALKIIKITTDIEAKLVVVGIVTMIFFQFVINIGMTIGICPITGLPLPLVSYGGSSMLTFALSVGILMNIYKERSIF